MSDDKQLETMWDSLADVPFDENENGELVIAEDWEHFHKGDSQEDIWHWFDERHSKGVAWLLYRVDGLECYCKK